MKITWLVSLHPYNTFKMGFSKCSHISKISQWQDLYILVYTHKIVLHLHQSRTKSLLMNKQSSKQTTFCGQQNSVLLDLHEILIRNCSNMDQTNNNLKDCKLVSHPIWEEIKRKKKRKYIGIESWRRITKNNYLKWIISTWFSLIFYHCRSSGCGCRNPLSNKDF